MSDDPTPAGRLATLTEKNLLVALGGIIIGAFVAGIGALLFIQRTVKTEIDD